MPNPLVLIVDDSPSLVGLVGLLLSANGFRATMAGDGLSALVAAQRERPDLILLDLNIPKLDGFDVLMALRSDPELKYIPVVILSGDDKVSTVDRAYANGATNFIRKPFDESRLLAKLRTVLEASPATRIH